MNSFGDSDQAIFSKYHYSITGSTTEKSKNDFEQKVRSKVLIQPNFKYSVFQTVSHSSNFDKFDKEKKGCVYLIGNRCIYWYLHCIVPQIKVLKSPAVNN